MDEVSKVGSLGNIGPLKYLRIPSHNSLLTSCNPKLTGDRALLCMQSLASAVVLSCSLCIKLELYTCPKLIQSLQAE